MKDYTEHLNNLITSFNNEFDKFRNGNKTAGKRARAHLQEIKVLCQEARVAIQAEKNKENK